MTFHDFHLAPELLKAVTNLGYATPTPIQSQAIPLILEGSDLLAGAQTGTGKTAGFVLPLLHHLLKSPSKSIVRALILTPTRELASQVEESVRNLGKYTSLKSTVIFGGVSDKPQISNLRKGIDIVVATPGRLLDLINQKAIQLNQLEILVLDEADRMLDMGFIHDIRRIIKFLPKQRQTLLFSATFSEEIKKIAREFLHEPKIVQATNSNSAAEGISHIVHPVDKKRKGALLSFLIQSKGLKQVLVFARTKHGANRLSMQLTNDGIISSAIHGNKSQGARTKALDDFKSGKVQALVATDIAARGIDIEQLPHVINFELPQVPEDYVHRIGRTGRAGNKGEAISLVCIDEHKLLIDIEKLLKSKIPNQIIPGYEPDPSIKAEPIINGRQQKPGTRPNQNGRQQQSRSRQPQNGRQQQNQRSRSRP